MAEENSVDSDRVLDQYINEEGNPNFNDDAIIDKETSNISPALPEERNKKNEQIVNDQENELQKKTQQLKYSHCQNELML